MGSLSPNPNAWSGLLSTWSISMQSREYRSTQLNPTQLKTLFNWTPLICNPPRWQTVAALQNDCTVDWPMRPQCLPVGFAENLHKISVYCCDEDQSYIICRHDCCHCAGSICKRWFWNWSRYGAVWRNIQQPGLKTVRHNWPRPAVRQSLRLSPSRQRLHDYTHRNLFLVVSAAAPCSPVQCLEPISPIEVLSTVTPSRPVWSPTLRKNVQTTCSLASRLSIAVAPSICIHEVQPLSERASSLAVIQVHSRGIPDGLPGQLQHHPHTLGFQRQNSIAL